MGEKKGWEESRFPTSFSALSGFYSFSNDFCSGQQTSYPQIWFGIETEPYLSNLQVL